MTTGDGGFLHEAVRYAGERDYVAALAPFVLSGLEAGEPVLVSIPADGWEALREELGRDATRVRWRDATLVGRNPGRVIPSVLTAFALESGPGPIRVVNEIVWPGRTRVELPACLRCEALINPVFTGTRLSVLCPYDVGRLSPEAASGARLAHPVLNGLSNPDYDPAGDYWNEPLAGPPTGATRLDFGPRDLSTVRALVAAQAAAAGVSPARVRDLQVAVNEVATNSLLYAGGKGILHLWQDESGLICDVQDSGRVSDPLVGLRRPHEREEGGRGLLIVNMLCDLVRIHTDEISTNVRLYLAV